MWKTVSLAAPVSSAASLSADVMVFTVSPWTDGEGKGLHRYLSFPNAVAAVVSKLTGVVDPVFIIAITAANEADFAGQCALLNSAFPLKQLQSWQKQSASLAKLEVDKFDLVEPVPNSNNVAINAVPTLQSLQKAAWSQTAKVDAAGLSASDPLSNLTAFQANKAAFDVAVDSSLTDASAGLSGGAGWSFYAESDIANALQQGHPGSEYTLTAMMVLSAPKVQLQVLTEIFA